MRYLPSSGTTKLMKASEEDRKLSKFNQLEVKRGEHHGDGE
jgi:hypothetical protein